MSWYNYYHYNQTSCLIVLIYDWFMFDICIVKRWLILYLIKTIYVTFTCPNSKVYTLFTDSKLYTICIIVKYTNSKVYTKLPDSIFF